MITSPITHKFTVNDVIVMEEAGVLHPEERFELLNGEIMDMSPIHPSHANCVTLLNRLFTRNLSPEAYIVSIQNPVKLSDISVLQPDVTIAYYRQELLHNEFIRPLDVALIIEVADSTYHFDRSNKLSAYAEAGVGEYWIVNLSKRQIEVYLGPEAGKYAKAVTYLDVFDTSLGFPLKVADILPGRS